MNQNKVNYLSIVVTLFTIQYFFHSFEALLVVSFFLGSALKLEKPIITLFISQITVLILLYLINGFDSVVLNKFASVMNIGNELLLFVVSLVSILSPMFAGYLGYTSKEFLAKRKAILSE